ncbi:hypothetical protein BDF21DRAFT_493744 [Thamnidium elegans]|nr:hypothetical protein BDF21DRAFT_493744 [Thamnidium elegans]
MSAQYLASEILSQIFILLPENSVYQCMLVCKTWNTSATIQFFSTLKLGGKNNYPLTLLAANLKNGYLGFFKYGYLVKNLIIEGPFEEFKDPLIFFSLIMCLPYLKSIDISRCSRRSFILENLQVFSNDLDLKYIQDVVVFPPNRLLLTDLTISLEYYSTCYKFRETVTCLRLHDVENGYVMENGEFKSFPDILLHFKQLTSLYIDDHPCPVEKEKRVEYQLPVILKTCPKLTDLRICRPDFIPRIGSLTSLLKTHPGSGFDGINLKRLSLNFSILDASLMQYILTSIDTSKMISFTFKKIQYDTFNEIANNKILFLKFISHTSLAQNFHFEIESRTFGAQYHRRIPYDPPKLHRVFWKMVQDLYYTRKLKRIDINIHLLPETQIHPLAYPKISCGLHITDNKLKFHQHISFKDFFDGREHGEIMSSLFNRYIANKTTTIEFCVQDRQFLEILFFVMTKLPNIEKLILKDPEKSPRSMIECYINHKSNINTYLDTHQLFSSVSIEGIDIKETTFSEIRHVIRNVEALRIRDCRLSTIEGCICFDERVLALDLTELKFLKSIALNLEVMTNEFDLATYLFKRVHTNGRLICKTYYTSHKLNGKHKFRLQKHMFNKELPEHPDGLVIIVSFCSDLSIIYL